KRNVYINVLLFVGMVMTAIPVTAQKSREGFAFGVKSGINISDLLTEEDLFVGEKSDIGNRVGYIGGVFAEYKFTRCFYLSGDVLFSSKGFKMKLPLKEEYGKVTFRLNYMDFPIMADFYVWKGVVLKVGLQPSVLLSSKVLWGGWNASMYKKFRHFDCSMPMGIAYDFECGWILDVRYSLGASCLLKSNANDEICNNSVFSLTAAFRF
ncbi:MAG TPA: PorT family protein, partial [Candidatus Butyricimonas faecavium]|nr:PorT family protein [Candidatus Butyricimonas faecavium]